jgi:two-component system nitrate/nitrite response regulator NarL
MVKIAVIDSHTLFRIGLVAILKDDARYDVVGEYKSFQAFKTLGTPRLPDLVLVDIAVNKECGLDLPRSIKEVSPTARVIVLTSIKEDFYIMNAVETDLDGFILKDAEPEEILKGIGRVLEGEKFYSHEISNLLVGNLYKRNYRGLPFLTAKEKEIIKLIMKGYSTKQIAGELLISPRTIDAHRANILGKFNLKNTTELVSRIAEHKIKI